MTLVSYIAAPHSALASKALEESLTGRQKLAGSAMAQYDSQTPHCRYAEGYSA